MANVHGTIGGDAELSPRGEQYALKLPELVAKSVAVSLLYQCCGASDLICNRMEEHLLSGPPL